MHDGHTSHVNCQIIVHYMKHYSVTLLFLEMDVGQPKNKNEGINGRKSYQQVFSIPKNIN